MLLAVRYMYCKFLMYCIHCTHTHTHRALRVMNVSHSLSVLLQMEVDVFLVLSIVMATARFVLEERN